MGERGELPNAGDLAIVVHVCGCDANRDMGRVVTVARLLLCGSTHIVRCATCHQPFGAVDCAICDTPEGAILFVRSWLRRIPPLVELESIDIVTELEREQKVSA